MPSSSSDNSRQSATARDDSEEHNNTFRSASSRNLELKATVVLVDRQETVAHRYDIQKTLGRGSTGTVLLASRDEMGGKAPSSLVALKRVNISRIPEGQYYSTMWSLLAESSTIKMAQPHPNIIRCSTPMCDVSNHDAYLELEYCSRGDLFGLIVDPHGFKNAIEPKCLFRDLVRGLSHIHSLGIAHRDLKPENLLVNETGTLKIGDFGFSTIVSEAERRIGKEIPFSSNAFLTKFGTLPYASPQLVEYYDKSKQLRQAFKVMYDPFAADVWATGIIFYRLRIDSHLPWEKAAKDDVMYRFYAGNRQIILNLWESFPENISQNEMHLLSRMLEIDAKKRITAKEILNHGAFVEYDHTCK